MAKKIMLLHNGRLVECSINCMATMTIIVIAVVGMMMTIFFMVMMITKMNQMMVKMTLHSGIVPECSINYIALMTINMMAVYRDGDDDDNPIDVDC